MFVALRAPATPSDRSYGVPTGSSHGALASVRSRYAVRFTQARPIDAIRADCRPLSVLAVGPVLGRIRRPSGSPWRSTVRGSCLARTRAGTPISSARRGDDFGRCIDASSPKRRFGHTHARWRGRHLPFRLRSQSESTSVHSRRLSRTAAILATVDIRTSTSPLSTRAI